MTVMMRKGPERHPTMEKTVGHAGLPVLVVMGVTGAGKTTIAEVLATSLGWAYKDGDALHPEANIARMHAGIPLTDADRKPWLERVAAWIDGRRAAKLPGIITCSALKRAYRWIVIGNRPEVRLIYLRGDRDLLTTRLAGRHGHFMAASLLQSQLDTLEEPTPTENPLIVDIERPIGEIAEHIIRQLQDPAAVGKSDA